MVIVAKYVGRLGIHAGASWHHFSVGFSVDRYSFSIDLGFVWVSLEF
jgi:hypothetical protein